MKLSILMPVYNELATLESAVERVLNVDYPIDIELVVVDDGSTDGTRALYSQWADEPRMLIHEKATNGGKGSAIRKGSELATGDYVIMCDADLEYAPEEIPSLLEPILRGDANVVYGTRTFGSHNAYSYLYVLGNKAVTTFTNILFNCYISDLETCFKLMPTSLYRTLDVRSAGFGMEAEVTGKILRSGVRPYEVPISYKARSRADGKKLTWRDGVEALWILVKERVRAPIAYEIDASPVLPLKARPKKVQGSSTNGKVDANVRPTVG
jgi:glycosyltransferase involved in cell wall biosynthesis